MTEPSNQVTHFRRDDPQSDAVSDRRAVEDAATTVGRGSWQLESDRFDLALVGGPVLVVDDNVVNQQLTLRQLEGLGCYADAVASGEDALAAISKTDYKVVFMDCQMPGMDGCETTLAIRKREGLLRHTPVIALTAGGLKGDREKCLAAGMDEYLIKPASTADLARALGRWMPQWRADRLTAFDDQQRNPESDQALVIRSKLLTLCHDLGTESVIELIDIFLPDASRRMERLHEVLISGDFQAIASEAHSLKSSCRTLGASRLGDLLAGLEKAGLIGQLEDPLKAWSEVAAEAARVRSRLSIERARLYEDAL
jgi:CheY-like chemotaxis protein/HPt (histidine-containing phosphotransfer) domain-containing protein